MSLTFLFTDLEGSTHLWEQFPKVMRSALERHDALLKEAVEAYRGHVVKMTGDGLHAVFEAASDGVAAALAGQQAITTEPWSEATGPLKVRMGLHTGESQERDGDFYGPTLNRAARVMGIGHGGQILLSEITATLVRKHPPPDCTLSDMGEHRLKGIALPERIFQLCHPDLVAEFPPLSSLATFKHNLHRQLSTFIGREKELVEVKRLLKETQLLTLLGPGGTGKTRLMLQVAEEVIEDYPDGVWLVELAPLTDPNLIQERVVAALNVQEQPNRSMFDTLADYLRRKELLLLLDNVEHLVRESAAFTEHLLEHCPKLTILVTGREALFIGGETTLQIPSLSLPQEKQALEEIAASEGVQLFLERARSVRPDFVLNGQNAVTIAEIVRRLDGIPLALELASARLRMLTVEQIAARLNDRFRLLTGGRRTALPRQQTLQALIEWSWNLLDEQERILLCRLSVFSGGWTLEEAQSICGFDPLDEFVVFDGLEQLINKSLVMVQHLAEGEARYGMLESIHQYAQEKLFEVGEVESLRDRHAEFFVLFVKRAEDHLHGPEMIRWLGMINRELDNLRAVMAWTIEGHLEWAMRLAVLFPIRGHRFLATEAILWLEQVVQKARHAGMETDDQKALFGATLAYFGTMLGLQGRNALARQNLEEAVSILREGKAYRKLVNALMGLGVMYAFLGKFDAIPPIVAEIFPLCRQHGFDYELGAVLSYAATLAAAHNDFETAKKQLDEATWLAQKVNNPLLNAMTYQQMATFTGIDDVEAAISLWRQARELYEQIGDSQFVNVCLSEEAHLLRINEDFKEALDIYAETILKWQEINHLPAVANQLECFAYIAAMQAQYNQAAQLLGAARVVRERLNVPVTKPQEITDLKQVMELLGEAMGEEDRDRVMAEGTKMSMDEAVEFAIEIVESQGTKKE